MFPGFQSKSQVGADGDDLLKYPTKSLLDYGNFAGKRKMGHVPILSDTSQPHLGVQRGNTTFKGMDIRRERSP
eukprot:1392350-Amorphochlora_amoeboformis.AAC.1